MSDPPLELNGLTSRQKQQWDRAGYLLLRGVMPPAQVDAMLGEVDRLDRLSQDFGHAAEASLDLNNVIDAPTEGLFSDGPGDARVIDPNPNDVFLDLIDHSAHLGAVCDLMGAAIHLSWSHLMIRPPSPTPSNRWHRDGPKPFLFPMVDGRMACQWIRVGWFLTDIDRPDMGNLCVIPGSHRHHRRQCHGWSAWNCDPLRGPLPERGPSR